MGENGVLSLGLLATMWGMVIFILMFTLPKWHKIGNWSM